MLFGLIEDSDRGRANESLPATITTLYERAGNLETELESLARRLPLTLLAPTQIRTYNQILTDARGLLPKSVVLKEDALLIEEGDLPHAETFYRIVHTAIVPTLHFALPEGDQH